MTKAKKTKAKKDISSPEYPPRGPLIECIESQTIRINIGRTEFSTDIVAVMRDTYNHTDQDGTQHKRLLVDMVDYAQKEFGVVMRPDGLELRIAANHFITGATIEHAMPIFQSHGPGFDFDRWLDINDGFYRKLDFRTVDRLWVFHYNKCCRWFALGVKWQADQDKGETLEEETDNEDKE